MRPDKRFAFTVATATMIFGLVSTVGEAQIRYPYPYPYGYRAVQPDSSVRIEVTPREAEVYVDAYYAGIVDDFDGVFQRLHVPPGEHEITIYRDGYRTVTQRVYLTPDNTFRIKYNMERLSPGEVAEGRPIPPNPPPQPVQAQGFGGRRVPPQGAPLPGEPQPAGPPPQYFPSAPPPPASQGVIGSISIRVQPGDADVLIDGQPMRPAAGADRLVVDTTEGRHTVQIRKPGYVGYLTEVDVRRGQTTPLDVNLRVQPQ